MIPQVAVFKLPRVAEHVGYAVQISFGEGLARERVEQQFTLPDAPDSFAGVAAFCAQVALAIGTLGKQIALRDQP